MQVARLPSLGPQPHQQKACIPLNIIEYPFTCHSTSFPSRSRRCYHSAFTIRHSKHTFDVLSVIPNVPRRPEDLQRCMMYNTVPQAIGLGNHGTHGHPLRYSRRQHPGGMSIYSIYISHSSSDLSSAMLSPDLWVIISRACDEPRD